MYVEGREGNQCAPSAAALGDALDAGAVLRLLARPFQTKPKTTLVASCKQARDSRQRGFSTHKGPRSPGSLARGSLQHEEGGKVWARVSPSTGDSPVPSCRVACAAPAKGAADGSREGSRPCHSTASPITFMAGFVVPAALQGAPAPRVPYETTAASLDFCDETSLGAVLQLITSYNFLKSILWMQIPGGNQNQPKYNEQRRESIPSPSHYPQEFAMNTWGGHSVVIWRPGSKCSVRP